MGINDVGRACGIGSMGPTSSKVATVESLIHRLRDSAERNRRLSNSLLDAVIRPEPAKCQVPSNEAMKVVTLEEHLRDLLNDIESNNGRLEEMCGIIDSQFGSLKLV
ncbi:MAG: hypothetical protein K0Q77_43 [Anaerosporomusa subterranea]|jgi:hypothetical protein|nr:hypothetical protein [Anaerosporomusa subterranea]MDF2572314.1 hypothetical protein [Sporomusa sp.]